jgi:hypothetical protein
MVSGTGRAYIDLSTTSELYTTKNCTCRRGSGRISIVVSWFIYRESVGIKSGRLVGITAMYPFVLCDARYHELPSWVVCRSALGQGR